MLTKAEFRKEMKKRLLASADTAHSCGKSAAERFLSQSGFTDKKSFFVFLSDKYEISTRPLIEGLQALGKDICVPVTADGKMKAVRFFSFDDLVKGEYGLLIPSRKVYADKRIIDVCVCPLLGILMENGKRIGRGGGYYDAFLSGFSGIKVGFCHDFQLVWKENGEIDRFDVESHDAALDCAVTDKRTIFFRQTVI